MRFAGCLLWLSSVTTEAARPLFSTARARLRPVRRGLFPVSSGLCHEWAPENTDGWQKFD